LSGNPRGNGGRLRAVKLLCQSCGAALQLEAGARTTVCPYCESAHVVQRPPEPDRPNPAFAVGFRLGREEAHQRVRKWLKGRTLFARSGVHRAKLEDVRGVYSPAYLYGAVAQSAYRAEIGEAYYETVTTGSGKNRQTRQERRVEWRPLAGEVEQYVPARVVTASLAIPNEELEKVEPFDLRLLARYRPEVLAGWIAEEASLSREECAVLARQEALAEVEQRLRAFLPGDERRALRHQTSLREESLELVLLPLWVFAARYAEDAPPMRILVNGQSGEAYGKLPLSWVKITLTVLLVLAVLAGAAFLLSGGGLR